MRRAPLFLIASATLVFAGCSSTDSNPQTETGAPSSSTSSVVVSADNAAACKGFEEYKEAQSATPTGGSDATANATSIQAYLTSLVAPLETIKAGAPTDLVLPVDTLITSAKDASELDPSNPADQTTISQLVLAPPAENAAAAESVTAWGSVNCGIDIGGD